MVASKRYDVHFYSLEMIASMYCVVDDVPPRSFVTCFRSWFNERERSDVIDSQRASLTIQRTPTYRQRLRDGVFDAVSERRQLYVPKHHDRGVQQRCGPAQRAVTPRRSNQRG